MNQNMVYETALEQARQIIPLFRGKDYTDVLNPKTNELFFEIPTFIRNEVAKDYDDMVEEEYTRSVHDESVFEGMNI